MADNMRNDNNNSFAYPVLCKHQGKQVSNQIQQNETENFYALLAYSIFWLAFFLFCQAVFSHCSSIRRLPDLDFRYWPAPSPTESSSIFQQLLISWQSPCLFLFRRIWLKGEWFRHFVRYYTWIILLISSLIIAGDSTLYSYWGFRMDYTPLLYLITPKDAAASVTTWPDNCILSYCYFINNGFRIIV